jgi:hypothetical protein
VDAVVVGFAGAERGATTTFFAVADVEVAKVNLVGVGTGVAGVAKENLGGVGVGIAVVPGVLEVDRTELVAGVAKEKRLGVEGVVAAVVVGVGVLCLPRAFDTLDCNP